MKSHDSYCDKKGFTFPLLSDPGKQVTKSYGATKMKGALVQRTVYVIGPGQKIIFAEKGTPPNQEIIAAIDADRR